MILFDIIRWLLYATSEEVFSSRNSVKNRDEKVGRRNQRMCFVLKLSNPLISSEKSTKGTAISVHVRVFSFQSDGHQHFFRWCRPLPNNAVNSELHNAMATVFAVRRNYMSHLNLDLSFSYTGCSLWLVSSNWWTI